MNPRTNLLPILLLAGALACAPRKPVFAYDVAPGFAFDKVETLARNPENLIWGSKDTHSVDAPEFRDAVMGALEAKGYRLVQDAGTADLWMDVIILAPGPGDRSGANQGNLFWGGGPRSGMAGMGGRSGMGGRDAPEQTMVRPMPAPRKRSEDEANTSLTVFVKFVSRADGKTVWYGSLEVPARKPGKDALGTPEALIQQFLQPLPARPRP